MTRALELDLDTPAPSRQPPRWRQHLPWTLFGVTLGALVMSLALHLAPTERHPDPLPAIGGQGTTALGVDLDSITWRDQDGKIHSVVDVVVPTGEADGSVWCRLMIEPGVEPWPVACEPVAQ